MILNYSIGSARPDNSIWIAIDIVNLICIRQNIGKEVKLILVRPKNPKPVIVTDPKNPFTVLIPPFFDSKNLTLGASSFKSLNSMRARIKFYQAIIIAADP